MFSIRYRFLFIFLLAAYSYLNIHFTIGERLFDFYIPQFYLFGILFLEVLGIWELNRLTELRLERIGATLNRRIHPLIILFILSMINVILVSVAILSAFYLVLGKQIQFNSASLTLLAAFGFRVNLFLNCIHAIVYFMNRLKKAQIEAEQLKKISIEAQFESLRNQINPHFLFNCFNVLSTLVYRDADTSAKFILQLSSVYRYLLYNQEKKVVPLADELVFLNAYIFLLEIRFGKNIQVENKVREEDTLAFVAPAVLQMLIENAIKHNIVSQRDPLKIRLFSGDGWIYVSNNLQEKRVKEPSTQVGIKNILERYGFLSDRRVEIEKTTSEFTVKIPLLNVAE